MVSAPIVTSVSEEDAISQITQTAAKANVPVIVYNGAPGTSQPLAKAIAHLSRVPTLLGSKTAAVIPVPSQRRERSQIQAVGCFAAKGISCQPGLRLVPTEASSFPHSSIPAEHLALYDAHIRGDLKIVRSLWKRALAADRGARQRQAILADDQAGRISARATSWNLPAAIGCRGIRANATGAYRNARTPQPHTGTARGHRRSRMPCSFK